MIALLTICAALFATAVVAVVVFALTRGWICRRETTANIDAFHNTHISMIRHFVDPSGWSETYYDANYPFVYTFGYFHVTNPNTCVLNVLETANLVDMYSVFSSVDVNRIRKCKCDWLSYDMRGAL